MELKFEPLTAKDIECRVSSINEKGCSLLLYKDARCDMRILDKVVGPMNWKRSHELIDGKLFCNVSIYDEDKAEWVTKQDVGTESYTEKEKGQASDSFKRACFNWGIGRELYTAPFIWIRAMDVGAEKKENGKYKIQELKVEDFEVKDGIITKISIKNEETGKICFRFPKERNPVNFPNSQKETLLEQEVKSWSLPLEKIEKLNGEIERTGVEPETILGMFGISSFKELTETQYEVIMKKFKKTKDKEKAS